MLQQARDEAHRFAITFQRKRRTVRTITSELLRIPGVGESKRRLLLTTFGSLQGIREATPEQIGALPGFSVRSGQRILDALRQSDVTAPSPSAPTSTPEAEPVTDASVDTLESADVEVAPEEVAAPISEPHTT
jgi:excinuclease ABC subunit C